MKSTHGRCKLAPARTPERARRHDAGTPPLQDVLLHSSPLNHHLLISSARPPTHGIFASALDGLAYSTMSIR